MNKVLSFPLIITNHIQGIKVTFFYELSKKRNLCTLTKINSNEILSSNVKVSEEIDWKKELDSLKREETSIFSKNNEDLSHFSKFLSPTFNFAAYVNKSETLSNFVKLGVDLHKLEKKYGALETISKLDFEKNVKQHLTFLSDYVDPKELGFFITKNPWIFEKPLEDLLIRINYLESKKFSLPMIKRILTKNPYWLNFRTLRIDQRLGHFQKEFKLTGDDVRSLATRQPRLITYKMHHIKHNTFVIKEELGFEPRELRKLLLAKPDLWMIHQDSLINRFNYVHNTMKISHEMISQMPGVLLCREFKIKQRHTFLQKLGRDQYHKNHPNYVSLISLVEGTDAEFCFKVAKCPVTDFNLYLKSL